ncbi:hypothetical protein D9757_001904 [Collybiopsis confluens]|uniref:Uncharacterized protein n=1 Tax=Collybiopsis confluens TaxID=2823264 RepID=A0A8H5HXU1_9AGAR|nr:hypothetical protein D9757_001904 [Collybiopsis confluens]
MSDPGFDSCPTSTSRLRQPHLIYLPSLCRLPGRNAAASSVLTLTLFVRQTRLSFTSTITTASPSSTPTSPLPDRTLAQVRRKTVAGNLAGWNTTHYEERIVLLEAQNSRLVDDLKAQRDALVDEREDRRIERQSLFTSTHSRSSTYSDISTRTGEQAEVLYERKLRMEILDSLKKVRAQNMSISRSLRESQDNHASLGSLLEAERREKEELREETKELCMKNFTLFEHNKLLVSRDSALQEEISSLMTKSQADDWMRSVLEQELQKLRQTSPVKEGYGDHGVERSPISAPTITLEHQGPLRAQLVAARDELHITRRCLEASENKCKELDSRVSSLQTNMSQCLDSSARALDVERGLRAEVEEYSRTLEEENSRLKAEIFKFQDPSSIAHTSATPLVPSHNSVREEAPLFKANPVSEPHHILCGDVQKITVDVRNVTLSPVADAGHSRVSLRMRHRERLLERQLRLSSSKKAARRRSSRQLSRTSALFSSVSSPVITDTPVFQSFALTPPVSPPPPIEPLHSFPVTPPRRPLPLPNAEIEARKRTPSGLRPLRLSMLVSPERLSQASQAQLPPTAVVPSPVFPRIPPPSPKKQIIPAEERNHRFRKNTSSTTNHPGSPDSTVSTLVAPSSAPTESDKGKFLILATTLSKKPSFDATLKSGTTLFLDKRKDREETRLPPSNTTKKSAKKLVNDATHMRRASAVLASIAKSTGIGSIEDCTVASY